MDNCSYVTETMPCGFSEKPYPPDNDQDDWIEDELAFVAAVDSLRRLNVTQRRQALAESEGS